jgi:error-prone DNA polymerase
MLIRKKQHRSSGGFSDLLGNAREVLGSPMLDRNMYPGSIERSSRAEEESAAYAAPNTSYAELHCHSNYSFQEGASDTQELLKRAQELGYRALAITDHDNLCGAMEFAQAARDVGIKAITGVEVTLMGGHHLTLLAETAEGYKNISRLTTHAHIDAEDRKVPELDLALLAEHAEGVICLSGCRDGEISTLVLQGKIERATQLARQYRDWFGSENFFLELQQNLVKDDTLRNRLMANIAAEVGVGVVATNNAHYHDVSRSRLNDALVAIQHNKSMEESHRERRPNDQFYLKYPDEMAALFTEYPEAISNTVRIAERCDLELTTDAIYEFPDYDTPDGHTSATWLRQLCEEAAIRRYGEVTRAVKERLDEEIRLLSMHDLCGFMLQYYDIIKIAREVQEELGLVEPGLPLEVNPPGRGRGSSVSMLVGYLIGLSHIDPLEFDLKLDRFLSEELGSVPDIDLDFPRDIREQLILRVHERWGYDRAVLTGMISTYRIKGCIRDLGKALGMPGEDLDKLTKRIDGHARVSQLGQELQELPEFRDRANSQQWRDLVELSQQLKGFPKYLAQHPGGMVLSARSLAETVPLQRSAMEGRFICQWDKDSIDDAGFVKIDFLALGALSQMNEAIKLIEVHREERVDLSLIDFADQKVYKSIHEADTIGVFQVESAAQMQTTPRIRPKDLKEMAWEVGAVRPGVGVNNGVSTLIRRHTGQETDWQYDHPLEREALERTLGVVLYQDQLMELGKYVAGMSAAEADRMRRAFSRRNADQLVPMWHEKFISGAMAKGVPIEAAEKIFLKFHGEFQFPEAHAFAFGVTAFQAAWLKYYYPLEFFVGLFNQQPMGFYNLETLKEDARRHGVEVLNPDVNRSDEKAVVESGNLRLGVRHVRRVQKATSQAILATRRRFGEFESISDFMMRAGIQHEALDNLADAGFFDSLDEDRRSTRWEIGLRYRPIGSQLGFDMPVDQDMVDLPGQSPFEVMVGEYRTMGVYPKGHLMAKLRPRLPPYMVRSDKVRDLPDGTDVWVGGIVIRRQMPLAKAVFMTLEDEFGQSPLVIWPTTWQRLKRIARAPVLLAHGTVSHREGTINVVVKDLKPIESGTPTLKTKDWG